MEVTKPHPARRPGAAEIWILPSTHAATRCRSGVPHLPVPGLASASCAAHNLRACSCGALKPTVPTAGHAPRLAAGQPPFRAMALDLGADEHVERQRTRAAWLGVSGLPRPEASVANGQVYARPATGSAGRTCRPLSSSLASGIT